MALSLLGWTVECFESSIWKGYFILKVFAESFQNLPRSKIIISVAGNPKRIIEEGCNRMRVGRFLKITSRQ